MGTDSEASFQVAGEICTGLQAFAGISYVLVLLSDNAVSTFGFTLFPCMFGESPGILSVVN